MYNVDKKRFFSPPSKTSALLSVTLDPYSTQPSLHRELKAYCLYLNLKIDGHHGDPWRGSSWLGIASIECLSERYVGPGSAAETQFRSPCQTPYRSHEPLICGHNNSMTATYERHSLKFSTNHPKVTLWMEGGGVTFGTEWRVHLGI